MTDLQRWARYHDAGHRLADDELLPCGGPERFSVEIGDGKTEHELAWADFRQRLGKVAPPS